MNLPEIWAVLSILLLIGALFIGRYWQRRALAVEAELERERDRHDATAAEGERRLNGWRAAEERERSAGYARKKAEDTLAKVREAIGAFAPTISTTSSGGPIVTPKE